MFAGIGAAVCAVLALVLIKTKKLPKVAAVLAFGAGGGIGGWLAGFAGTALGWVDGLAATVVGVSIIGLVAMALTLFVIFDLLPKGKASTGTAVMAFALAVLIAFVGGQAAQALGGLSDGIGGLAGSAFDSTF